MESKTETEFAEVDRDFTYDNLNSVLRLYCDYLSVFNDFYDSIRATAVRTFSGTPGAG